MRWADGESGVSRAREPVWVVSSMGAGTDADVDASGRRVRVVGKWPVWKVVWCRRRWPDMDLGSRWVCF